MRLNVNNLIYTLKNIRHIPEYAEEVIRLPIRPVKALQPIQEDNINYSATFKTIEIVAVRYCVTQSDCWLEWEVQC